MSSLFNNFKLGGGPVGVQQSGALAGRENLSCIRGKQMNYKYYMLIAVLLMKGKYCE